ncbi:hypothetical protein Hanom_Chr08g00738051 [Helianthus anomalus]
MPTGYADSVSAASMGVDVFRHGNGDDVVKKNNSDGWRLGKRFCLHVLFVLNHLKEKALLASICRFNIFLLLL